MLRTKGRMRRPCIKCGKTFEKKKKRQKLCWSCRNLAYKQGAETRQLFYQQNQPMRFIPEKKPDGYKRVNTEVTKEEYIAMKEAIKEMNSSKKEIQTQKTFINRAICFYTQMILSKQRGESFKD